MSERISTVTRPVRQITIKTGRPWAEFRAAYEEAVPQFDRLEAIGVVLSGGGWEGITRLSEATATNGFANFFVFDPSPVMALHGNAGKAVTYLTGNILKAEAGFSALPHCFLYVPLRIVIAAKDGDDAEMSFDHPADLFAAYSTPELAAVGRDFAQTLAALLDHLGLSVPTELLEPQPISHNKSLAART
jgi:hypothetical protein